MTWAQCLKRVFNIDIETCIKCGGSVTMIACIEDPVVTEKILDHKSVEPLSRCSGASQSALTPSSCATIHSFCRGSSCG